VHNVGTRASDGPITITDPLPKGLSYVSGIGNGWTCDVHQQMVTCLYSPTLAPGQSASMTLTVSVAASALPSIGNVATAQTAGAIAPSTASAVTAVAPAAAAPAMSWPAMAMGLMSLVAIAGVALRRRGAADQTD
jgi:hypothetical protein